MEQNTVFSFTLNFDLDLWNKSRISSTLATFRLSKNALEGLLGSFFLWQYIPVLAAMPIFL